MCLWAAEASRNWGETACSKRGCSADGKARVVDARLGAGCQRVCPGWLECHASAAGSLPASTIANLLLHLVLQCCLVLWRLVGHLKRVWLIVCHFAEVQGWKIINRNWY